MSPLTGRKQYLAKEQRMKSFAGTGWKGRKYTCDIKYSFPDCDFTVLFFLFSTNVDVILFLFTFVLAKTHIYNIMKFLAEFILLKP